MTQTRTPGITEQLTDFCVALKFQDLPPEVIANAKNGILDTLGVALIGSREESTRMVLKASTQSNKGGESTVMGTATLTAPDVAALVNGYAAHVLDYDDVQQNGAGTHMSAPVLPAALAMAEMLNCSGKDLLTAYVAGFDIGCRLGRAGRFCRHLLRQGIAGTGVLGHFGAAAAAGKLLKLDALQMRRSFGIAAGHTSGLTRSFGTMCKALNLANAAQSGVVSALLAKEGFTGPEDIFEGEKNIFSIYGGQTGPEELLRGLGQQFEINSNTLKIFPCAGQRNPIMEGSILLATIHGLQAKDIKEVKITVGVGVMNGPNYPEPRTGLEAKFSSQYAAAVALTDRAGGMAQFTDERVSDPMLAELTRRVILETDEGLRSHQTRVLIRTADRRELSHFIPAQKGGHLNPLSWDELAAKFRANALAVLTHVKGESLIAMIRDLETVGDIAELMHLCRSSD